MLEPLAKRLDDWWPTTYDSTLYCQPGRNTIRTYHNMIFVGSITAKKEYYVELEKSTIREDLRMHLIRVLAASIQPMTIYFVDLISVRSWNTDSSSHEFDKGSLS